MDSEKLVKIVIIVLGILALIMITLFALSQVFPNYQEQAPTRKSVLFYKCDDGILKNLLIDENNRSLYDYNIKKGCEIIE